MYDTKTLFEIRREIRQTILDIKISNDSETADAIWEDSYRQLTRLHNNNVLGQKTYQIFCSMLNQAITV